MKTKVRVSSTSSKRQTVYYHAPSAKQKRLDNPETKKEILAWYNRARTALDKRLRMSIRVPFESYLVIADAETKKVLRKAKKPTVDFIEKWKLSYADYEVYKGSLNRRFELLKQQYNQRVLEGRATKK